MCVLELSTLRGVREGPLSDVSYDSLISILDFTTLTQFVWVHFRMSRTIRSWANHGFLLHLVARPCPAECLYGCPGSSPGLVQVTWPMPVEAQSAACAVLIKASIQETMISLHFRFRDSPAHI